MRCIGEQQSKRDVPAPQINRLIVCIAQFKTDSLECDTSTRRIIEQMATVLLMQNAAVAGSHVEARKDVAAARWAQTLVVRERGTVQTHRVCAIDVNGAGDSRR